MSTKIILIVGPQGAGKTTVANEVAKHTDSIVMSFADPMREMLASLSKFSLTEQEYTPQELKYTDKNKVRDWLGGQSYRFAAQRLGTEYGRGMLKDSIWVDLMKNRISRNIKNKTIIIDDCRFKNEFDLLNNEFDCACILLERTDIPDQSKNHGSEVEWKLMDFDSIIKNESLHDCTKNIIEHYFQSS